MPNGPVVVVGATGVLGRELTRRLLAAGERVVAVTRDASRARDLTALGADVRVADLVDHGAIAQAIRGAGVVIAAAHSLLGRGRYSSGHVDDAGHRALIDAAKAQGVAHFAYISVLGASATHPVAFWRTKDAIERYLSASGLTHTILRPAAFMETHAHELLGKSILEGKVAIVFGAGERPVNFVAAGDVAAIAVLALANRSAPSRTIEIGGPENLTRNEVAATYARVAGRDARVRHVPLGVLRVLSPVIGAVHPGFGRVLGAAVVFDGLDQTFDATATLRQYPVTLTRLEDFVRARIVAPTHEGTPQASADSFTR